MGAGDVSEGDWLEQSMDDRRLQFVIAVSPAVNWLRQGRYNLLAELRQEGADQRRIHEAMRRREAILRLLWEAASYEEYRAAVGDGSDVTPGRWRFITRNYTADAVADLRAMRGTPVLLVLAGHDANMDVAETEAVYREFSPFHAECRALPRRHALAGAPRNRTLAAAPDRDRCSRTSEAVRGGLPRPAGPFPAAGRCGRGSFVNVPSCTGGAAGRRNGPRRGLRRGSAVRGCVVPAHNDRPSGCWARPGRMPLLRSVNFGQEGTV
ncbi:hypothetical protein [Streptomyces sp. NPDC052693]|uniref:hypothetical protein n=1 Tax=Streptomyces sp. NPDC052693 TaxID=3155814 RepID=UPI00341DA5C7